MGEGRGDQLIKLRIDILEVGVGWGFSPLTPLFSTSATSATPDKADVAHFVRFFSHMEELKAETILRLKDAFHCAALDKTNVTALPPALRSSLFVSI